MSRRVLGFVAAQAWKAFWADEIASSTCLLLAAEHSQISLVDIGLITGNLASVVTSWPLMMSGIVPPETGPAWLSMAFGYVMAGCKHDLPYRALANLQSSNSEQNFNSPDT